MTNSDLSQLFFDEQSALTCWKISLALEVHRSFWIRFAYYFWWFLLAFHSDILILKISIKHKTDSIIILFYHYSSLLPEILHLSRMERWLFSFLFFLSVSFIQQKIKESKFSFLFSVRKRWWNQMDRYMLLSNYLPLLLIPIVVSFVLCFFKFVPIYRTLRIILFRSFDFEVFWIPTEGLTPCVNLTYFFFK